MADDTDVPDPDIWEGHLVLDDFPVGTAPTDPTKVCPVHRRKLYPKNTRFGARWQCHAVGCDVVCWDSPTSTPADEATRALRRRCHAVFDERWKKVGEPGRRGKKAREKARVKAYEWLSEVMCLPKELAHIGMMDRYQCLLLLRHLGLNELPEPDDLPFVLAIVAVPEDDLRRLVWADYLEEKGKPAPCWNKLCKGGRWEAKIVVAQQDQDILSDMDPETGTFQCQTCGGAGFIAGGQAQIARSLRQPGVKLSLFPTVNGKGLVTVLWPATRNVQIAKLPEELFQFVAKNVGGKPVGAGITMELVYKPDLTLTPNPDGD